MDDNKKYSINLPENDNLMFQKFKGLIEDIRSFRLDDYKQNNKEKCLNCIYEPACDRSLI